jgi:hypothetical protein
MPTTKQGGGAKRIAKKAPAKRDSVSRGGRAHTHPRGGRAKAGSTGGGEYFHVEVRPRSDFVSFRTHDVGEPGGIQRVAGKRESGTWDTQKWLIGKELAHVDGDRLVPDTDAAREVLESLGSVPERIEADRFRAKPPRNIPEREKPTRAQQAARSRNIKKAQAASRKE